MIWEISVACIAIAFIVLVIFVVKTLKAAEQSLHKTTETLQDVQKTIEELSSEVKQVVRQTSELTGDLQHKMKQIDPVLESVKNAGEVINEVTLAAKQVSTALVGRIKGRQKAVKAYRLKSKQDVQKVEENAQVERSDAQGSRKPVKWVKWVDVAADMWLKYRG